MNTETATNVLKSWFRANDIAVTKSTVPGCMTVACRLGGDIEVRVCARQDETMPAPGVVDVLAKEILHKDLERAMAAYHGILATAGYGPLMPFNRGQEPEHKLCYTDDEFLVGIRHTEVRRSPDCAPEKYAMYDKVMHKAAWKFYNSNREFCNRVGYTVEDLMQSCMMMLSTFCARQERDDVEQTHNEKTLYVWLRQRFAEIRRVLIRKDRSVSSDADTVSIGLFGTPGRIALDFEQNNDPRDVEGEELQQRLLGSQGSEPTDVDYRKRKRELDCSSPTARKSSAAKMLSERLGAMDHDEMVELLKFTRQNILVAYDARREAAKQLRMHESTCENCTPSLEVDINEETGGEELSAEE